MIITSREQAIYFLNKLPWKNAKSYEKTLPHWYTTRDRVNDNESFNSLLEFIRKHGSLKNFYRKQYLYLEVDNYEYWEMGRPILAVQVLNKALIDDSKPYRGTPNKSLLLKQEQELKQKLAKRELVLKQLLEVENPTPKQSQQIKFLMDTQRRIHGGGKNIIDHSSLNIRYE